MDLTGKSFFSGVKEDLDLTCVMSAVSAFNTAGRRGAGEESVGAREDDEKVYPSILSPQGPAARTNSPSEREKEKGRVRGGGGEGIRFRCH